MTRVSSFGHQQIMLTSLLNNQARVFTDQMQITTGKKDENYGSNAREISTLLGAKSVFDRTQGYLRATSHVERFLRTNDIQLDNIVHNAQNLRDSMLEAIAQEESFALNELLEESYTAMTSALNTNIGGVYIFSGSRSDTPPVVGSDLSDLVAAATVSDLFQNDQRRPMAKIAQKTTIEYGLLADEVAQDTFQVFKDIAAFDAGPSGPLSGKLDATQIAFLESELGNMDAVIEGLQVLVARNGTRQNNVENFTHEHEGQEAFLEIFISDIENTDIAEAITRLSNDQVALQASYQMTSQLSRLSLLEYI